MEISRVLAAAILVAAVVRTGQAASVTANYSTDAPAEAVRIASSTGGYANSTNGDGGGIYNGDTIAGPSNFVSTALDTSSPPTGLTAANLSGEFGVGKSFQGYCVDLTHFIYLNETGVSWTVGRLTDVTSLINGVGISGPKATAIAELFNEHYDDSLGNAYGYNPGNAAAETATFQLALWQLLYTNYEGGKGHGTYGVTFSAGGWSPDGEAPVTPAVLTAASTWADSAWDNKGTTDKSVSVYALVDGHDSGGNRQNFSVSFIGVGNGPVIVPLPAAAWAGFAMLGGLGVLRVFGKKTIHFEQSLVESSVLDVGVVVMGLGSWELVRHRPQKR